MSKPKLQPDPAWVPRDAVRLPELARRLSICQRSAYTLVVSGKIRSVRAGGCILIPVEAIADFLAGR